LGAFVVLKNRQGSVIRTMPWGGQDMQVVRDAITRRVRLCVDPEKLVKQGRKLLHLGTISGEKLRREGSLTVQGLGELQLVNEVGAVASDIHSEDNNQGLIRNLMALALFLVFAIYFTIGQLNLELPTVKEEMKERLVQIVQRKPGVKQSQRKVAQPKARNINKTGALAALGSLSSAKFSGIKMTNKKSSRGPGLGGTKGSGGVQSAMFAKGLVAAPVGAGNNIQGLGGYGTRGKGGGQAGFGSSSLVGSTGSIGLPQAGDGSIGGGLSMEEVAAVIRRNMAQVRFCYEQGLQKTPGLAGRVPTHFAIGASGQVLSADVKKSSLGSSTVEQCIIRRLKTWQFPKPRGGQKVEVVFPFKLSRTTS